MSALYRYTHTNPDVFSACLDMEEFDVSHSYDSQYFRSVDRFETIANSIEFLLYNSNYDCLKILLKKRPHCVQLAIEKKPKISFDIMFSSRISESENIVNCLESVVEIIEQLPDNIYASKIAKAPEMRKFILTIIDEFKAKSDLCATFLFS